MSSILTSQIETPEVNEKATSTLHEVVAVISMFAVTATIVLLTSLTWAA